VSVALVIILAVILISAAVGIYAGRNLKMNLENWTVGGRRFGVILIWLLMAGEIYTTFTFLGASGWAYSKGAPAYYILVYGALAYTLSFFILPVLWKVGKRHGLHTQPDFFIKRYDSRGLGVLVAVIGVFSIIPYLGVPAIYFGGIGKMMQALIAKMPEHLVFPGSTTNMDVLWVMSTILVTAMGFYMWPHIYGSVFAAKSDKVLKRNAIIMPFYQIPILLIFFVGFTALLTIPGLANGDLAFLELVKKTYPPWFLGFVGAAGAVTAMVPAAILVLFAATLVGKNIYQSGFRPKAPEERVMRVSRIMVIVIMTVSLFFALKFPNELVPLLILGYDGVSQFFPGVVFGLFWKKVTKAGVLAGILTGVAVVAVLILTKNDPFLGINAGFVGLVFNTGVTVAVSLATRKGTSSDIGS
jgi:SSS family solute:Na+ symporter